MTRPPVDRVIHWFALDKAIDRMHQKKSTANALTEAGPIRTHHDEYPERIVVTTNKENNHHDNRS